MARSVPPYPSGSASSEPERPASGPSRRILIGGLATLGLGAGNLHAQPAKAPAPKPAGPAPSEPAAPPAAAEAKPLSAAPGTMRLRPEPAPETTVWCFDGRTAPPTVRVKLGEPVRLILKNATDKPLSLHWHGVRIVNAMDGVGGVTQAPVPPGGEFLYAFTPPDAGTFLIRPLVVGGASEPSGRGLAGLLIVEEAKPPAVDADLGLLLQDWRLEADGSLMPFGQTAFAAAGGRLGNVVTVNGGPVPQAVEARPGSRLRLRLANGCNARATRLKFEGVKVYVSAVDGQPTDTFEPLRATLPFPPGTRYDLLIDLPEEEGATASVVAMIGQGLTLASVTTKGPKLGTARPPIGPIGENKLLPREVKLQNALRRDVVITGGAFVPKDKPGADPVYTGDPQKVWLVNGASAATGLSPIFSVKRGQVVVLALRNDTAFPQSLHLHGHCFRLLHPLDDGWEPYWLDTFQLLEGRTARIAFQADNPGRWLISATVLERFDTGLWTMFEVT
ncbi:multicopper oxidase family protein [Methylobacterium aerolatum]|uniref:FtsP/CotA-like multicopper oxidase with cupredoxin domain n=1 Tax=Methylobacterium aerolatum TaxID=418708 RepID=A0ABU0HTG0_9HYPH|nr:multicopper oxidase family protein [Methylobacterium aerolatum]MDQ0445624.1 FtsP/CotA-like multicopper oxidase with cupredoxin domain [Methylobacterium aerolatum]GJD36267.1 Multicopper oxidase MmcO [Methylobacterium aerolatum]